MKARLEDHDIPLPLVLLQYMRSGQWSQVGRLDAGAPRKGGTGVIRWNNDVCWQLFVFFIGHPKLAKNRYLSIYNRKPQVQLRLLYRCIQLEASIGPPHGYLLDSLQPQSVLML